MPIQRIAAVLDLQGTVSRSLGRATQRTARALEGVTRKTKELKRESDRLSKLRVAEEKKYGRALEETRRKINQVSRALREQQRAEELLRARQRRVVRMERVRAGAGRGALAAGVGGALAFRAITRREDVAGLAASRGLGSVQSIIADLMRRFRVREEQAAAAVAASIEGGDRTMQAVTQRATRGMMLAAGGTGRIDQAPVLTDALSRFEDAFDRTLTMPEVSALGAALNTTNVEIATLSTMLNRNTAVITSMGGPQVMAETVIAAQLGGFTKPGRFLQTLLDTLTRARVSGKGRFVEGTFGTGASTNPQVFLRGAMQFIERHGEDRALEAFREMAFTERVSDILKFGSALANNTEEARRRIAGFDIQQASGAFAAARPATGAIVSWQAQLTELMGHTAEALQQTNPALDKLNKWLDSVGSGGFWAVALGGVTLATALKMGAAGALFRGAVAAAGIAFGASLGVRSAAAAGVGAASAAALGGRRGGGGRRGAGAGALRSSEPGSMSARRPGGRGMLGLAARSIPGIGTAMIAAEALWAARHDVRLSPEDLLAARERERQGTAHGRMTAITHPLAGSGDVTMTPMAVSAMSRHGRRVSSSSGATSGTFRPMGRHGRRRAPRAHVPASRAWPAALRRDSHGRDIGLSMQDFRDTMPPALRRDSHARDIGLPAQSFRDAMPSDVDSGGTATPYALPEQHLTITIIQQPGEGDDSTLDRAMAKMREWIRSEREDRFASEFGFDPTVP